MRKTIYLLLLFAIVANAQTYTWKYAKQGGGENSSNGTGFDDSSDEIILDSKVDSQNNSYFLARLYDGNAQLLGSSIPTYGANDILIFSTDCGGNLRWSRTIGGYENDYAQHIVIDNNGGLYISVDVTNPGALGNPNYPKVHFGDNDILPDYDPNDTQNPQEGVKTGFLLKYNTANGQEIWRRDFQGDILINFDENKASVDIAATTIDSNGIIHVLLGLFGGTHLNGLVTVPQSYYNQYGQLPMGYKFFMVKYDSNGNIIRQPTPIPLSKTVMGTWIKLSLIYDEVNSRYYLAGRTKPFTNTIYPVAFNNIPFDNDGYIISFDTAGNEIWRREIVMPTNVNCKFFSLKKKDNGLYVSGYYVPIDGNATFNGQPLPNTVTFYNNFIMRLTLDGNLVWIRKPNNTTYNTGTTTLYNPRPDSRSDIAFSGNEVALVKGSTFEVWDSYSTVRNQGDENDPLLLRFNRDTGDLIAAHEVKGDYGHRDEFTSISTDSDGNYILGGFFESQIFTDSPNGVGPLVNPAPGTKTNFFVAKLAKTDCTNLGTAETAIKDTDVSFYPNPVDDILTIKTSHEIDRYQIVTADGRLVHEGDFKNRDYRLNLKELTTGVYYLKVLGKDFATAGKVIKK